MNAPPQFSSSDVWLLQAIGMAGQTAPASLSDIIAAGDYINHAIFTWEELQTVLSRLLAAKLIETQGTGLMLSQAFADEYDRLPNGEALQSYLQQLPVTQTKNLVNVPVTQTDFEAAVREYQHQDEPIRR